MHPLPVITDGFEVGVVAPLAVGGPDIAGEVALEVFIPAVLEVGETLEVLDVRFAGRIGSLEAFDDRESRAFTSSVTSEQPSTSTSLESLSGWLAAR